LRGIVPSCPPPTNPHLWSGLWQAPELNGVRIPDGLADVAKIVLLTFDIVINKGK
jgi:hypothetical protein